MSRIVRMTCLCLLGAFALGACSDGGAVSGPQKETAQRADAICKAAQKKVGDNLGDDPAADRDAIKAATDELMKIDAPSENENAWILLVQSTNNLWISLEDVAQALDPNVNDRARADRARTKVRDLNNDVRKYGKDYDANICAQGYGA